MGLTEYKKKRDFTSTAEPAGKIERSGENRFVVQRHEAGRLHYDFRLELDGVLKSWAIPKGPSLNPKDKRLAVKVEDHPVSYIGFSGKIPEGNYGAGIVAIWDSGEFIPVNEQNEEITQNKAISDLKNGQLKFLLKGKKLKGGFALVQLKSSDSKKNWLLIKHRDKYATDDEYNSEDHVGRKSKKQAE